MLDRSTVGRLTLAQEIGVRVPVRQPVVPLVNGWSGIQSDDRHLRHTKRVLRSVEKYNPDAAKLMKYLAEFVTLHCAPDLLALRVFPNGKEISESFGAYDAVRYRLQQFALNDPSVTVIAVGDGKTPRTAATFAMRSRWQCYSVDPRLKGGVRRWEAIDRLTVVPKHIEDVRIHAERAIVVAVHSHANLLNSVAAVEAKEIAVVAMPCCVRMELDRPPDLEYEEKGVISPCRTVRIWRNVSDDSR